MITGQLAERAFIISDQQELIGHAMVNRPEIRRSRHIIDAAKERVRGARGELLPRLDLIGGFGASGHSFGTGSSDYTLGASLTFNIFDAGRKARIKQARAAEAVASAEQEQLANRIRFEVVRAYQQYVTARERVKVASRVVDQAKESLRIVQDRYREGLTTVTETIRAETTFVRARQTLLAARYDQYIGYAGILLATGRLNDVVPFLG
jgi:outer membrane protein TolC